MTEQEFIFCALFLPTFQKHTEMAYDELFPIVQKIFNHWVMTDSLYGRPDHECTYDSIERYLKENSYNITALIKE